LDILSMTDVNFRDLSKQLDLATINKDRFIRILRYSNSLLEDISFLENIPDDVIFAIFSTLDC